MLPLTSMPAITKLGPSQDSAPDKPVQPCSNPSRVANPRSPFWAGWDKPALPRTRSPTSNRPQRAVSDTPTLHLCAAGFRSHLPQPAPGTPEVAVAGLPAKSKQLKPRAGNTGSGAFESLQIPVLPLLQCIRARDLTTSATRPRNVPDIPALAQANFPRDCSMPSSQV